MATIGKQAPVSSAKFISDISPQIEPNPNASAFVQGNQTVALGTTNGVVAGQRLNVDYYGYFPSLPQDQGFGSATVSVHWKTANAEGDSAPVQDSGWWGYGTRVSFDVPQDAQGPLLLNFTETRKDGVQVPDAQIYTTDLLPSDAPIMKFSDDWSNTLNGALKRGGAFKVAYDVDRLRSQMNLAAGDKANIQALVSFDGKYPQVKSLLYSDALGDHVDMPEFRIPDDAQSVRVWFVGGKQNGAYNQQKYDSDYGNNFSASIDS